LILQKDLDFCAE